MTLFEELNRRTLLYEQATQFLRQESERHEAEAKRLREEAAQSVEVEP